MIIFFLLYNYLIPLLFITNMIKNNYYSNNIIIYYNYLLIL